MFQRLILILLAALLVAGCSAQSSPPSFDSSKAFSLLQKQCDFGPRPPGSTAHDKTKDFLASELRRYSDSVELQDFQRTLGGKNIPMTNIIAGFGPKTGRSVLLCAHWDTRPTADEELDPADRKRPIIGANDGASGVAVLLELAHMFAAKPPDVPVTIVLFDGEDYGQTPDQMFLGSREFAKHQNKGIYKFRYGILLDMIGDKDLQIYREVHSEESAKEVNDKIWAAARELGYENSFKNQKKYSISDDHLPLIEAGLPCVDVIDFDYAYWHTLEDTPDKCSPQSLKIVGETIAKVVYSERL